MINRNRVEVGLYRRIGVVLYACVSIFKLQNNVMLTFWGQ